jgi:hypothetical protein
MKFYSKEGKELVNKKVFKNKSNAFAFYKDQLPDAAIVSTDECDANGDYLESLKEWTVYFL